MNEEGRFRRWERRRFKRWGIEREADEFSPILVKARIVWHQQVGDYNIHGVYFVIYYVSRSRSTNLGQVGQTRGIRLSTQARGALFFPDLPFIPFRQITRQAGATTLGKFMVRQAKEQGGVTHSPWHPCLPVF